MDQTAAGRQENKSGPPLIRRAASSYKGLLIQNALLQDEILHGAAGLNGPLGQVGRRLVADMGAQGRDDAHAVVHHGLAPRGVGRDPHDAVVHQCMYRVGQGLHRLDEMIKDNGLKGVELQLSGLRCHGHGHVSANDMEGHLIDHLRDHRVYLARHDGGAVLAGRQVDLIEAAAGARGEQPEVVAHLGEIDRTGLYRAGDSHKFVQILGGVNEVKGLDEPQARDLGEIGHDAAEVLFVGVDAGADGGAAHIEAAHLILRPLQADDVPADGLTVGAEFLPQTDGDRVLHLGASHLDHPVELLRLLGEGGIQPLQLNLSTDEELEHCHLSRRGKNIVGGLPIVHMIIGIH